MRSFMAFVSAVIVSALPALAQDSTVLRQSYNGKFGFYRPSPAISNGLVVGADGMTEFVRYDIFASLGLDLYLKQSFNPFVGSSPRIDQQSLILIPVTLGGGYKVIDIRDADSRLYVGAGAGYSLYFYRLVYSAPGGGLLGSGLTSEDHSASSGMFTASVQLRIVVGKVFVEPKLYFAKEARTTLGGSYTYTIDPSGFIITVGYSAK
jgi:hypothetical protein